MPTPEMVEPPLGEGVVGGRRVSVLQEWGDLLTLRSMGLKCKEESDRKKEYNVVERIVNGIMPNHLK